MQTEASLEDPIIPGLDLDGTTVPSFWVESKPGVYFIRFKYSPMIYIGSSSDLYQRMHGHLSVLKRNLHKNKGLQELYNEHGDCFFTFFVMSESTEHEYRLAEKLAIDLYRVKGLTLNGSVPPIRPVIIHGIRYPSVPAACTALGLTSTGINHRAISLTAQFADCYYEGETKESRKHNFGPNMITVTVNDEQITLAELGRRTGIKDKTLYKRYREGVPTDKLHLTRPFNKVVTYAHDGKELTLKEWAVELGIDYTTLLHRMTKQGMPFEDAVLGSLREVRKLRGEPLYQRAASK